MTTAANTGNLFYAGWLVEVGHWIKVPIKEEVFGPDVSYHNHYTPSSPAISGSVVAVSGSEVALIARYLSPSQTPHDIFHHGEHGQSSAYHRRWQGRGSRWVRHVGWVTGGCMLSSFQGAEAQGKLLASMWECHVDGACSRFDDPVGAGRISGRGKSNEDGAGAGCQLLERCKCGFLSKRIVSLCISVQLAGPSSRDYPEELGWLACRAYTTGRLRQIRCIWSSTTSNSIPRMPTRWCSASKAPTTRRKAPTAAQRVFARLSKRRWRCCHPASSLSTSSNVRGSTLRSLSRPQSRHWPKWSRRARSAASGWARPARTRSGRPMPYIPSRPSRSSWACSRPTLFTTVLRTCAMSVRYPLEKEAEKKKTHLLTLWSTQQLAFPSRHTAPSAAACWRAIYASSTTWRRMTSGTCCRASSPKISIRIWSSSRRWGRLPSARAWPRRRWPSAGCVARAPSPSPAPPRRRASSRTASLRRSPTKTWPRSRKSSKPCLFPASAMAASMRRC